MKFRILIPFWGALPQYRTLLLNWLSSYRSLQLPHEVTIITDHKTPEVEETGVPWLRLDTPDFDAHYQFDHKGDIVCAAIQKILDPVLVLDTDAVLAADPAPLLEPFREERICMPLDEGALGRYIRNRHGQESTVKKRCAGVIWFGSPFKRAELVDKYHWALDELKSGRYYEERRLFEQHAWSYVAHLTRGGILPRELNWLDNNTRNGPNPKAAINHRIGQRKFNPIRPPITA